MRSGAKPIARIRFTLLAHDAKPSPVLNQALGQYRINIMEFCKNYNNRTKNIRGHVYIPTATTIYNASTYEVTVKTPSTTYFLKKILGQRGRPTQKALSLQEIYHLAVYKKCDPLLNHLSLEAICKTLIGSAKSMGRLVG